MPDNEKMIVYGHDGLTVTALAAVPTATDAGTDVIAVWAGVDVNSGQGAVADWITRSAAAGEAAAGTSWEFIKRGVYGVWVTCSIAAAAVVHGGIYLDATAAQTATDPSLANAQCLDAALVTTPAATTTPLKLFAAIGVTQTLAETPGLEIGRAHV